MILTPPDAPFRAHVCACLINSPMLPNLKGDDDGGLTICIQADLPVEVGEANRLPAPNSPFWARLRVYWPEQAALDGTWNQPPLTPVVWAWQPA